VGPAPATAVVNAGLNPVLSFRDLAREQLPRLLSLARRLVGEDAEDAVQDCLLKAYCRFDQLHDAAAGPAWLTSILVNCCRDRGRTRARQPVEIDFDQVERFRYTARSPTKTRSPTRTRCIWTSSPSSAVRTYGRC
jgi:DNA-directed RNA polymerase specialized sigma24 family protein